MPAKKKMVRVKNSTLCSRKVSFSYSDNSQEKGKLIEPFDTNFKKQKDCREIKTTGPIVEYESCCIDGFVIYSFTTAEEQREFCPLTSLKVFPQLKNPVSVVPKPTKKPKNLEEILFIDCGAPIQENKDVTPTCKKNCCSSCGKVFLLQSSLEFHLRNTVPKNSVLLTCEFCPHMSYGSNTMRMHVRQLHGKRIYDKFRSDDIKELFDEQIPACKRHCANGANI